MPSQTTAIPVDVLSPSSRVAQVAVWEVAGAVRDSHGLAHSSGEVGGDRVPAAETLFLRKEERFGCKFKACASQI